MQYENDVLERIANGEDAECILKETCPTAEKRFTLATGNLVRLLKDVQKEFPDAMYYTASGGLCLMLGCHHNDNGTAQQELIAVSADTLEIGDGDF